jgi:rhodanese-related sulfurtransferase
MNVSKQLRLVVAAAAILLAVAIAGFAFVPTPIVSVGPPSLQATVKSIAQRWPEIGHIAPERVAPLVDEGKVVIFDVRQDAEYAVSHLPGAIHVKPETSRAEFIERYGDDVKTKKVVFYCSVGARSSMLASRVADDLKARGAVSVDDLAGGIFAWHGERLPLVDAHGRTEFVHPFDSNWGRLVSRQGFVRTKPGS